jgi:hypothetical protein
VIAHGMLRLHDAARPALVAGTYRLDVSTTTAGGGHTSATAHDVVVVAPQLDLRDHAPLATVPAPDAADASPDELPFVVLRRRTMPWERDGLGVAGVPWLALVVTAEAEAAVATAPLGSIVALDGIDPATPVSVLRTADPARQAALLPRAAEVGLLCHVREVNLEDTALANGDDDGWLAVVVAIRLPRAAGTWRASLVSLEGRADLTGPNPRHGLLLLHTWTFTVSAAGAGLSGLAAARFGVPGSPGVTADGRVRVARTGRDGNVTESLYRSPLLPGRPGVPGDGPDDDLSDLAAAELGRMLVAADEAFLREVLEWRRAQQRAERSAVVEGIVAGLVPAAPLRSVAGLAADGAGPARLPDRLAAEALGTWLGTAPSTIDRRGANRPTREEDPS